TTRCCKRCSCSRGTARRTTQLDAPQRLSSRPRNLRGNAIGDVGKVGWKRGQSITMVDCDAGRRPAKGKEPVRAATCSRTRAQRYGWLTDDESLSCQASVCGASALLPGPLQRGRHGRVLCGGPDLAPVLFRVPSVPIRV